MRSRFCSAPALALLLAAAPSTAAEPTTTVPVAPAPPAAAPATATPPAASLEAPSKITFEDAIARTLARNPSALTAQQEILRSEALVREVRAGSFPTLYGNGLFTQLDGTRKLGTPPNQTIALPGTSLAANVVGSLPLVAAQRWVQWAHAKDQEDISKVSAQDVRRSLAITAARAYLAVIAQQRTLEVDQRAWKTAQAHYEFAHGRYAGGVGNRLDEVRAQQQAESTRAQAEIALFLLARAQEALGVVLGADAPMDAAADPSLAAPPSVAEALRDAASRRSDVKLQQEKLVAAQKVLHDSWADYMPSLTGTFEPFYQAPPTLTVPRTGWQAQLILSVPFYDGGLRYGQRDERQALQGEAELSLQAVLRQVQSDVRSSFEELTRSDQALGASQQAARLAKLALDLADQAYAAGATTNLEVIDAERASLDADTTAAIAEDGDRQARLDVLAATGRFP